MSKNKAKSYNIERLEELAEMYGVQDNPLFLTTLDRYKTQIKVINTMRDALESAGAIVEKEYVKGRENVYAHPLIKEMPKACDSANKTADMLLKIINSLGAEMGAKDPLIEFLGGDV